MGLYSGARGVYADQERTRDTLAPDGIAVSFLHTGRSYADDLTEDGVLYHYPKTKRPGHDKSEIAASKAAYRSGLPVFVIGPGSSTATRSVYRGYVERFDDELRVLLITFTQSYGSACADVENLRDVLDEIRAVAPGKPGATPYHRAVAKLLAGLFSLSLGNGRIETPIHNAMKRIDITYDNVAMGGFFHWVALHYPAATVVVECKNYGKDAANPEFDQIAMRFSPNHGRMASSRADRLQTRSARWLGPELFQLTRTVT